MRMTGRILPLLPLTMLFPFMLSAQADTIESTDINKAFFRAIKLSGRPDFLATDGDDAWVIDDNNSRIQKISVKKDTPLLTIHLPGACGAPVVGFDALWVMSCSENTLYKIDTRTGRVLGKMATGIADDQGEISLATGEGSVWLLTDSAGILERIDPLRVKVRARITVRPHSYCAGFGYHSIWVTNTGDHSVQRIDCRSNQVVQTIPVGRRPRFLAVGEQGIWTLNQGDGTVTRIDPVTNKVVASIDAKVPGGGGDIAAGGGKIWIVSTNKERPLQRINPATNAIGTIYTYEGADHRRQLRVDGAVRVSGKYVWISNLYGGIVWVLPK